MCVFNTEPITMAAGVVPFLRKDRWPTYLPLHYTQNGNRLATSSMTWHRELWGSNTDQGQAQKGYVGIKGTSQEMNSIGQNTHTLSPGCVPGPSHQTFLPPVPTTQTTKMMGQRNILPPSLTRR